MENKTPKEIHDEAVAEAKKAVNEFLTAWRKENPDHQEKYGGMHEPLCCGFAWVKVRPATTPFARFLKKEGIVRYPSHNGGYDVYDPSGWVGQSIDVKERGAEAYEKVLRKYGITAYAMSRLD
jgi:hypothetical protein